MVASNVRQPCEGAIWHILPYIRAGLARELAKRGLTQEAIAEKMGLTQAAVSQYISGKRAREGVFDEHALDLVKKLATDIGEGGPVDLQKRICTICNYINNKPALLKELGVEAESSESTPTCQLEV